MARSLAAPLSLAPIAALVAIAVGCGVPLASNARAAEPAAPAPDAGNTGASGNLSDRLNRSGGVIKPPEDIDPGLQKPPPENSGKMPVIPPPGSAGGDPNVKPK